MPASSSHVGGCKGRAMTSNSASYKLMQAFFSPAVALMSRLDVTRKFVLLGLMSLVAVAVVVYSLFASLDQSIGFMERELKGIELIRPFPHVVQILQQHRGLSAGLLGGDAAMRDSRTAKEGDVVGAFKAMEEKLPPDPASSNDLQRIRDDWKHLREEGLNWTMAENFAAHTRLLDRIQLLEVAIADEYALILDPELDTYYLIDTTVNKLPQAIEHLGQLRAYGTGILARKRATGSQKVEMSILISKLDDAIEDLKISLGKTGRYNPTLQELIAAVSGDINGSVRQITGLVASDILSGHFATPPDDFYEMSTAAIDRSYAQIYEALLPTTETLIKARIARAKNTLRTSIGIAFLLFLAVAYFSIGISRAIIANIRSLARSAHAFAGGDLRERVELGARDELGQVGDSFNEMADGFSALLKVSRESEARLHDLSVHLEERVRGRTIELELARREAEVLLRRNQALMLNSMDGIHVMDMQGNLVAANDAFCCMLGYTQKEVSGLNVAGWDTQWSIEELQAMFRELVGKSAMVETTHRRKDGTLIDVEISTCGVELEGQNLIFASSRDITVRKKAEAALRRHKVVIDTAIDGFWIVDAMGNLLEANEAYAKISGYSIDELVNMHVSQLEAKEQSPEEVKAHIAKVVAQGYDRFETRHRRKDGHEIDIEISVTYMAESQQLFVFCRDITERKRAEEEIRNLAFYDVLTKLPNRRLFIDRFRAALSASARHNNFGAVLFIDMDRFKALNDTFGHDYGDLLLIEVAARIKSCVREMDTVARLGGDEFVVLIEEISNNRGDALRKVGLVAEKIRETLAHPYRLNEREHHSSPSIGISLYHGNGETVDLLLQHADMAMYQAKNSGRNAVRLFDASMQHDVMRMPDCGGRGV